MLHLHSSAMACSLHLACITPKLVPSTHSSAPSPQRACLKQGARTSFLPQGLDRHGRMAGCRRRRRHGVQALFGLGVPELAVIAGVAAIVFGPKKLPELGKSLGKTLKSFQQAAKEFETELKKEDVVSTERDKPEASAVITPDVGKEKSEV